MWLTPQCYLVGIEHTSPFPFFFQVEVTGRLKVDRRKALLYGKARKTKSSLTIGIPTLRRQGVDYLEKTLFSLITHSDASQQMSIVVVIFMVDMDKTWTRIRSKQLAVKYPKLIQSGFLQIVHPHDQSIYPDFGKLKRTYNDSLERVAWRSKQNIDYAYLFAYSQNISKYYLQLEDDVVAASDYYRDIVSFIDSNSNRFWYYLEVSHIGFIGKLIRSSDLGGLSEYIMMFFDEQPGDLLLIALGKIKTQSKRIVATRSLFQHIGTVSSLPGKVQKIIDKHFKDSFDKRFKNAFGLKDSFSLKQYPRKRFYHSNPSAKIDTNIEVYSNYNPVYAYDLSNRFFWGVSPRRGGNFRVIFHVPQNISRIFIDSGSTEIDTDILYDGKLLVSSSISNEERTPCQNFTTISKFENGDIDTSKSNVSLPVNIDCIVIAVMANQTDWLVIREIAIFLPGELEITEPSNQLSQKPSKERVMIGKDALEKSDSLKPHLAHRNSIERHTVFNIRGHNKQYEPGHTDDHVSYPPYRGVTVNLGDKDVKHFERESDVKQASDMNQTTTSRVQHPFEQHYDNVTQRDDAMNIYNSTGVNKYSRKRFYHVNPPATIHTQIETFSGYKPVYAYDLSDTFFWGSYPKQGDYFLILLKSPQNISRIFIDSGYEGKEFDILQNARLLISTRTPGNEERTCQKLGAVALFVNGDVDTKISNISLPVNIDCIAIELTANQNDRLIIREIAVFLSGELESAKLDKITSSPQMREERKVLEQTFKRNETLKRLFVSKQSLGSVQTKNPDNIKSQWQDLQGHTDSRRSNLNQPKESLDRRPYVSPNHRQINVHDANDAKNRSETLFKNGYAIDRNKLLKNGRHHRYQPTSDSRFNNSEDKRVQQRTYSLLQQNNTEFSHNIETNRKKLYVNPWHTSDAKVVEKVTTDKKTSNVKRVPEVTKIVNYTLEHRKEQKYNDRQTDNIANKTEKNGVNQYSRKRFYHVNPPATIHTQIETFSGYKPIYAYDLSDAFFWGSYPKQGDYFLILLKSPQNISRIFIDSGYEEKESDILQNARLLISTRTPGNEERACQKLGAVALFVNGDVDTEISNISLPVNIDCIAIEITANQNDRLIIREIAVFLSG
ncbi:Alpha-1,3-mannosyl-glycoprotein 4-beta-N-acetylglucosaminyltransferase C [Mizuhopecten yessoensis]|uniref:Alpha-1,3-mannosyl-glycoprotein 4-beta-N-acetylglucosaminyltransferase C n=1 Tax=Mizuhopecten yessoensis TaxID=6573 RepID=A0A210R153_MIZYE|nr:Alpha-1,3-mannosyl-glycoprotein 4-beta-N-acetylglucosaminyltransferase C [Mizuhopecten yessoensis]